MVLTRIHLKPDYEECISHFNDTNVCTFLWPTWEPGMSAR